MPNLQHQRPILGKKTSTLIKSLMFMTDWHTPDPTIPPTVLLYWGRIGCGEIINNYEIINYYHA